MKHPKNAVIKKGCHSRKLVSGIYNACRCQRKENALLNRCVEDPRLQTSGMTPSFTTTRGFIARSVIPQCWYAGYSGRNGFTLIELLVVVLIIGILAAVAVPQYQKAVYKARTTEAMAVLKSLKQAQIVYFLANNEYTNDLSKLDVDIPSNSFSGDVTAETADPNKFYYDCRGKRYCSARIFNKDVPDFEIANDGHRFYCLAYGKSKMAHDICKSMGKSDPNAWKPEDYFLINL